MTQLLYGSESEVTFFSDGQNLLASGFVKELTFVVQQLEGIPLDRVVAGGQDETTIGLFGCDSYFCSWGSGEADVDDIKAHANQRTRYALVAHFARQTGITANNDAAFLVPNFLLDYSGVCSCKLYNIKRVQTLTLLASDSATDARN